MSDILLHANGLVKRFGAVTASDELSLDVRKGEIHALIGPNGAGKTTAIGQLSGEIRPDAGTVRFAGRDITALGVSARARAGLARSFQVASLFGGFTAEDNVAMAIQAHQGHNFGFWRDARRDETLRRPARSMLARIGLVGRKDVAAASLAHGEQRQLELAMALATEPELLLLDEPMAGMGREEARSMVELLSGLKRRLSILLVEHDMDVVFSLADRITVLVYGRAIASGAPEEIRADAQVREAYLGTTA